MSLFYVYPVFQLGWFCQKKCFQKQGVLKKGKKGERPYRGAVYRTRDSNLSTMYVS